LPRSNYVLTDNEGMLLSLVVRAEPITAYKIAKVYDQSPISNFNTSKGKIYPMIQRLRAAGLLRARPIRDDARGTERLETTKKGRKAVRNWIKEIRPTHLLPEDPLRTKLQSFELLSREERIEWLSELKVELAKKLEEVAQYDHGDGGQFHDLVLENALSNIRGRIEWMDEVLNRVRSDKG